MNTPDFVAQANVWKSNVDSFYANNSELTAKTIAKDKEKKINSKKDASQNTDSGVSAYEIKSGAIGINPNSSSWSFDLLMEDGKSFTREDMKANMKNESFDGPEGETFDALQIKMRMKGSNSLISVDSTKDISLDGRNLTLASVEPMKVKIWKDNSGMGQWYIQFEGGGVAAITDDDGNDLELPGSTVTISDPHEAIENIDNENTNDQLAKGINIEISWPLDADYEQRTKMKYYFEVYN